MAMDIINERDIIAFLNQRQQLIENELKKINAVIKIIESSSLILANGRSGLGGATMSSPQRNKTIRKALQPQTKFLKDGFLDQKISYALTQLGSGYKEDILEILIEEEPLADLFNLQNALGVRLSYLLKNDMITGEKHGRKYHYTFKL